VGDARTFSAISARRDEVYSFSTTYDSQCRYGMHCSTCSLAKERRSLGKLRVLVRWHDFTTSAALWMWCNSVLSIRTGIMLSIVLTYLVFSKMLILLYLIETSNVTKVYCPQQLTSQRAKLRATYSVIRNFPWRYWKQIKQQHCQSETLWTKIILFLVIKYVYSGINSLHSNVLFKDETLARAGCTYIWNHIVPLCLSFFLVTLEVATR
jgi:hypothetical protein